jgi:translation initiation factor 1
MTRLFAGTPFDRPPTCERCGKLLTECACPPVVAEKILVPPKQQTAKLAVERRKKGKVVTVIRGLEAEANDLPGLLARLKTCCGAGGTLDGSTLEVQGDHLERLRTLLSDIGYRVRG